MENSERLGRQARPLFEPGTSGLQVLKRCGGIVGQFLISMPYPEFEPGTLGVAADSPSQYTAWSAVNLERNSCFSTYVWKNQQNTILNETCSSNCSCDVSFSQS